MALLAELSNGAYTRGDGIPTHDLGLGDVRKTASYVVPRFMKVPQRKPGTNEWVDVEYIEERVPGDKLVAPMSKVRDHHRETYRAQYDRWLQGQEIVTEGTPLEMWPVLRGVPALVETMKYNHIYTVEQLANIAEGNLSAIGMGARKYWNLAKQFVETIKGSDAVERIALENEELQQQVKQQTKTIEELLTRLKAIEDNSAARAQVKKG